MAVVFGCTTDTTTFGICQDIEIEDTAEIAVVQDADGDTSADTNNLQEFDEQQTISLTYVVDGTAKPTAGGEMTISGDKFKVETVKQTESNTDFQRFEIAGRRWIPNAVPA